MIENKKQAHSREEVFTLLKQILAEMTDNKLEDIREDSLIYDELNLTEFDVQRIIKQVGLKIDVDVDELLEQVDKEDAETVADLVEMITDEKELG